MSVFTNPASSSAGHASAYISAILDTLGQREPAGVLAETPRRLRRVVERLTPGQLTTPEAPGKWSVAQVIRHLADSEIVWGWRLRMVLSHDRPKITGYDQDLWAQRLGYESASATDSLEQFDVLRRGNLALVRRATPSDLKRVGVHEERGEESVEHMMRLYAGHDLVHERQIDRIVAAVTG